MIIKNQYLLAALVVLGVLQLWALACLERASSRVESRLKEEITSSRSDHQKATDVLLKDLNDTRSRVEQIQSELRNAQNLLNQTRAELENVKKAAATKDAAAGGEERKQ